MNGRRLRTAHRVEYSYSDVPSIRKARQLKPTDPMVWRSLITSVVISNCSEAKRRISVEGRDSSMLASRCSKTSDPHARHTQRRAACLDYRATRGDFSDSQCIYPDVVVLSRCFRTHEPQSNQWIPAIILIRYHSIPCNIQTTEKCPISEIQIARTASGLSEGLLPNW